MHTLFVDLCCLGLRKAERKSHKVCAEMQWTCSLCLLPFSQEECLTNCLQEEFNSINNSVEEDDYANNNAGKAVYANALDAMKPCIGESPGRLIIEERKTNSSGALIVHLNINSIQNKFDELKILNNSLRAHILVLSGTKVDSSHPSSQFDLPGYQMYRKERKTGGGRLIAYFSSALPSKKRALPNTFKTLEAIAVIVKIGSNYLLVLSIYRPPKQKRMGNESSLQDLKSVQEELNHIC